MFDDDDLFNLTDDSFEWDLLLDDDELEQDRKTVSYTHLTLPTT